MLTYKIMPLLSVIIPVYNESQTITQILEKVSAVNIDKEIIVVEDGSSDGTDKILRKINYHNLKVIYHTTNRGKGAAVLTGLTNATGKFLILQDADLEYDPEDYIKLLDEIHRDDADLILGVRFTKGYNGLLIPRLGNRFLTCLLNLLFRAKLNDFLTCYKLLPRVTMQALNLKSRSFNIETEIVAKALKMKLRIKQIPISYRPRTYAEGKKIKLKDGLQAIIGIIKYRFSN